MFCKPFLIAIPEQERAKRIRGIDIRKDELPPVQRALGVQWCVEYDFLTGKNFQSIGDRSCDSVTNKFLNKIGQPPL